MTTIVEGATTPQQRSALAGQIASGVVDASAYAAFATDDKVEGDSLAALRALAEELVSAERNLETAMATVVRARDALASVQEKKLPDMMEAANLTKFTFHDATTGLNRVIELISKWAVSMPAKQGKTADPQWATKHEAIYNWLVEIGNGAVIKKDMVTPLGLMPDDEAADIMQTFKAEHPDLEVTFEKYVEPATLTALVSKMKDDGKDVNEFLQVKPRREAKVKAGKGK